MQKDDLSGTLRKEGVPRLIGELKSGGISKGQVAECLGIHPSTLSQHLSSGDWRLEHLDCILERLGERTVHHWVDEDQRELHRKLCEILLLGEDLERRQVTLSIESAYALYESRQPK